VTNHDADTRAGCAVCSAPTGDDGYLCKAHTQDLRADLQSLLPRWEIRNGRRERISGAVEDLDVTITRQDRLQSEKHGGRSATRPLPWNEHAAVKQFELNTTLNAWALDASRVREDERDQLIHAHHSDTAAVAEWLIRNLNALRHHTEAGTAHDEITNAIHEARRAVDRPIERIFAGPCGAELKDDHDAPTGKVCTEDLYGTPGKSTAVCPCGARHDMTERREWMLGCLEDQVAHSGLLSGLVTNLGVPIASSTIRKYASSGRIKVISVDASRRPLYRIGDVLDVFLKRAA
jgi:hypothetical protein